MSLAMYLITDAESFPLKRSANQVTQGVKNAEIVIGVADN